MTSPTPVPVPTVLSVLSDSSSQTAFSLAVISRQRDGCWNLTSLIPGVSAEDTYSLSGRYSVSGTRKTVPLLSSQSQSCPQGTSDNVRRSLGLSQSLFLAAYRHQLGILPTVLQHVRLPHRTISVKCADPNY